jgi:predicted enzyme related to lactoylglutathione lyase
MSRVCSFTSWWIVAETVDALVAHGGKIVQPIGPDAPEITARFCDPAGNVLRLYQQSYTGVELGCPLL